MRLEPSFHFRITVFAVAAVTTDGELCVFPFTFMKKTYKECTKVERMGSKPFCSTTASYDTDGKWGVCEEGDRERKITFSPGSSESRGFHSPTFLLFQLLVNGDPPYCSSATTPLAEALRSCCSRRPTV